MADITIKWTIPGGFNQDGGQLDASRIYQLLVQRLGLDTGKAGFDDPSWYWKITGRDPFAMDQERHDLPPLAAAAVLANLLPKELAYADAIAKVDLDPLIAVAAKALETGSTVNGQAPLAGAGESFNPDRILPPATQALKAMQEERVTAQRATDEMYVRAAPGYENISAESLQAMLDKMAELRAAGQTTLGAKDSAAQAGEQARILEEAAAAVKVSTSADNSNPATIPIDATTGVDPTTGKTMVGFDANAAAQSDKSTKKFIPEDDLRSMIRSTNVDPFNSVNSKLNDGSLSYEPSVSMSGLPGTQMLNGGFPGQPGSSLMTLSQAVDWIYRREPNSAELNAIQDKLLQAGYLETGKYRMGVVDEPTAAAWRSLIGAAWTADKPVSAYTNAMIEGRKAMLDQVVNARSVMDQDQFAFTANALAQQVIGRKLSPQEVAKLRTQFIDFDHQVGMDQANQQPSVQWNDTNQSAWLSNRIRAANANESSRNEMFTNRMALNDAMGVKVRLPKLTEEQRLAVVHMAETNQWTPDRMVQHILETYGSRN